MNTVVAAKRHIIIAEPCTESKEDKLLLDLRRSGETLAKMFNINEEHITKAIKEAREEWK